MDVIKSQVVNELKVHSGEGERKSIILIDAIPSLDIGIDEEKEEEKRKKNVKPLKNSIRSKIVFKWKIKEKHITCILQLCTYFVLTLNSVNKD